MTNEYIIGTCRFCKKKPVPVAKRELKLPTGEIARSQDLMCDDCFLPLEKRFSAYYEAKLVEEGLI